MVTCVDLGQDIEKKSQLLCIFYSEFWIHILQQPEYKSLATIALKKLVILPTTYMAENGFSALVDFKSKGNILKHVDELMRGALEELVLPRIKTFPNNFQKQVVAELINNAQSIHHRNYFK